MRTEIISNTIFMKLIWLILLTFSLTGVMQAQDVQDDPEARKIFEEVDDRRDKVGSERAEMQMVIYDSRGNTRRRTLQSFNQNNDDISRSLLIFEEPANVRGTGFLSISEGSDEVQKLYLPALGQIQIISASEKSDRFMGSDFTYEDLGDQAPEDYRFELASKSDTTHILRATKKEKSQYAYMLFYIDPDRYVLQKIEYFNEQDVIIKRLEASDYVEVMDEVWQPGKMVMYDLQADRKTELSWSNREVNSSIPSWRFTERGLRRGL